MRNDAASFSLRYLRSSSTVSNFGGVIKFKKSELSSKNDSELG